jgi:hypothetical protein
MGRSLRCKIQVQYETLPNEVEGRDEKNERSKHYVRQYDNAVHACDQSIRSERTRLWLEGLAWDGANRAIELVHTCELAQDQYEFSAQPCVIHRGTLDVAAQLI